MVMSVMERIYHIVMSVMERIYHMVMSDEENVSHGNVCDGENVDIKVLNREGDRLNYQPLPCDRLNWHTLLNQ
jgi:hypothetical protein